MNETECKYWSFDGGNSQRGICAIDNKFCDCLVGERDCYYKQLKRLEAQNREFKACLEDFNKPEVKKVLVYYHTGELDRLEEKCEALEQENKKLKDEIGYLQQVLLKIKDLAMCGGDCEQDCDHCMQGQIHQLIKEALKDDQIMRITKEALDEQLH